MEKEYSFEDVLRESEIWCSRHPGWVRYCDIPDTDACYKTWEELSNRERRSWEKTYQNCGKDAWEEFGTRPCKYPQGYVSGAGVFYRDVRLVPRFHNFMTVIKMG